MRVKWRNSGFETCQKITFYDNSYRVIYFFNILTKYILLFQTTVTRNGKVRQRKELYHCNICDIKFTSNKKLRDHCIKLHGTANVLWICKFCGKSMTTKVSLQIHQRIHFDSKPYICEWCGNGYRSEPLFFHYIGGHSFL